ncbi:peptidoglycan hydrolase RipC [Mycolicibacterium goodii]|uniref:Peptidoglycan hydrolase RipC n=1 Tax=Mycolicibacterium goodii TaxID=134601 RepID=A0ABS6HWF4_MYCGD|nr:peptidoglycan hydrolase RipC [Mycolicibacterium goodii]MBU8827011.1 peptidoglycan hydrolase RipC [Mycolicibacterium goodii]MBU8840465.1 peptidoglycan hydrolase RipC [Mycolicibacterium goodii]
MPRRRIRAVSRSRWGSSCALALVISILFSGAATVHADPAADALARMNELSREAERLTEQMYAAEIDVESKVAAQRAADERHRIDLDAAASADAVLTGYQVAVDEAAAASYMTGSASTLSTFLVATSPQRMIDDLSLRTLMADQMSERMTAYRAAITTARAAAVTSQQSAEQARTAAAAAAAVRADLQAKQGRVKDQIAVVETQYRALTPQQQAVLADPGPTPPAAPDPAILALPDTGTDTQIRTGASNVVQAALSRIGSPYSWGASGPAAFDCSGLIKWAFLQGGKSLPRSSQALAAGGEPVSVESLQPGDIVTFYPDASHAGIYIGQGNMVHASTYGTPVKVAPISSAPIYNARRY